MNSAIAKRPKTVWVYMGLSGEPDIVQDFEPEDWDGVDYENGTGLWCPYADGQQCWFKLPLLSKKQFKPSSLGSHDAGDMPNCPRCGTVERCGVGWLNCECSDTDTGLDEGQWLDRVELLEKQAKKGKENA